LKGNYQIAGNDDMTNLKQFATMNLEKPVIQLSFSPKGDYAIASNAEAFVSYEIEHSRSFSGALDSSQGETFTQLRWLDTAHVWNQQNGSLIMRDFDNSNSYSINAVTGNFDVTLSQNGRYLYSIGSSDKGFSFQRVKMILE